MDSHMQKNETDYYLTPYTKINSNLIKNLNIRPETVELLEENIVGKLLTWVLARIFWIWHQKATKAKINKWDYIKLKSFCIPKETINKMKRQHTEWENILADHITDKRLISKIYEEPTQLNSKKTQTIWFKNWQRTWIDIFPQKTYKWPKGRWKDAQHH